MNNPFLIRDSYAEHFYDVLAVAKSEDELIDNLSDEEIKDYTANDLDDYAVQNANDMDYIPE